MCLCLSSGGGESFDVSDLAERVNGLRKDLAQLENEECRLEQDRVIMEQYIQQITNDNHR